MARKYKTYLGIDPGIHITGLSVIRVHGGEGLDKAMELLYIGHVKTNTKDSDNVRIAKIKSEVARLVSEYKVDKIVCEAYEVRSWQGPRKRAGITSKVVNEITAIAFLLNKPVILSSPDVKKYLPKIEGKINSLLDEYGKKISYRDHVTDSVLHLVYTLGVQEYE